MTTSLPRSSAVPARAVPPPAPRLVRPDRPRPGGRPVARRDSRDPGDGDPRAQGRELAIREGVGAFFAQYGMLLDGDDLPAVARRHGEPTVVVTDEASVVVSRHAEVVTFFRAVLAEHRARGLVSARPTVELVEPRTERLLEAVVRWSYLDGDGRIAFVDRYRYLLRRESPAGLTIQTTVVLEAPHAPQPEAPRARPS